MNGNYTITKAAQARTYDSKYGEMVVWKVRLQDVTTERTDGVFELHKKPGNEPKIGDTLEVERSQEGESPNGEPFVRLFLAKPQNAGGGGSYGGGSRSDDQRGESIERQVAAKVAGEMAAAVPAQDPMVAAANFEGFFDAVLAKIKYGTGTPQLNGSQAGGEVPADTRDFVPAPAGVSDDVPF